MNFSDTVAPALSLLDSLGPWGVLVGALLTIVGPRLVPLVAKLGPAAAAAYAAVLALFARKPSAEPVPLTPAEPKATHPLLENIVTVIRAKALAKRSYLEPDDALRFYLADLLNGRESESVIDSLPQPCDAVFTPAPGAIKDYPPSAGD